MSEELEQLARRAMACKAFGWRPGMRVWCGEHLSPLRFVGPRVGHQPVARVDGPSPPGMVTRYVYVPDLADAATLGCLEGLVCEAWRDPDAHLMRLTGLQTFGNWRMVGNPPAGVLGRMSPDGYPTRAEALVAALEAASGVAP